MSAERSPAAEPDPVFAAIDAANQAGWDHLSALAGLIGNEDDEAQMRRVKAAAEADAAAALALTQTMPTTLDGLRALVERYAIEAEGDDPTGASGRYLRHIASALQTRESEAPFSVGGAGKPTSAEALACPNQDKPAAGYDVDTVGGAA